MRLLQRFVRRWPIGVLGVLATIVLCLATMQLVPPTYSAKATLVLTPPPSAPTATTTGNPNPYMQLGGLQPLADIVSRSMMSSTSLVSLRKAGLSGSYTVARDTATDGPVLTVTTKAKVSAAVLRDLRLVLAAAGPQLARLQSSETVAAKDRVTITVVARDTTASTSRKSQVRALVVVIVAGLVATALAVTLIDLLLVRRTAKAGPTAPDRRRVTRLGAAEAATSADSTSAPLDAPAPTAGDGFPARVIARSRTLVRPLTSRPRSQSQVNGGGPGVEQRDGADAVEMRRRPRPGPEPAGPATSTVTARTRRRNPATGPSTSPTSESAEPIEPEREPNDQAGSRAP